MVATAHRFGRFVVLECSQRQPVYLTPDEARALSQELKSCSEVARHHEQTEDDDGDDGGAGAGSRAGPGGI